MPPHWKMNRGRPRPLHGRSAKNCVWFLFVVATVSVATQLSHEGQRQRDERGFHIAAPAPSSLLSGGSEFRQISPRAASRRLQSSTTTAYLDPATRSTGTLEAGTECVELPFDAVFKGKTALPKALDLLLIVDTTGSMRTVIATAQSQALDLLSAVRDAGIKDLRTAVADVRDYPGEYISRSCGEVYGGATDYPWKLHQALTSSDTLVQNALLSLTLGDGYDAPESYLTALYHAFTDKAIGWRGGGVAKVVVEFGDNIPHSCSSKICPHSFVTGIEPGADLKVGTADDITIDKVITGFRNSDITLFQLGNQYDTYGVWSCIANATGGAAEAMDTDIAKQITSLITDSFDNVGELELVACPSNSSNMGEGMANSTAYIRKVIPEHYTSIALDESSKTFKFNARLCPPVTAKAGTYNVSFCLVGDGATLTTAVTTVRVMEAPTPEPTPRPSHSPTPEPTAAPTAEPTATPTAAPTFEPSFAPSFRPTSEPTTATPTVAPTEAPTQEPSSAPSESPTSRPTKAPTFRPTRTLKPTAAPSLPPTPAPVMETPAPTQSNWTIELEDFRAGCTEGAVQSFLLQRVASSGAVAASYSGSISSGCPVDMILDADGNPVVVGYTSGAAAAVASTGGQRRLQNTAAAAEDFVVHADADTLAELCASFLGSVEALGLPKSLVATDGGVDTTVYLTTADDSEFTFDLYNDGVCNTAPLISSGDKVSIAGRNIGIALSAFAAAAVLLSLAASPRTLSAATMAGVPKDGSRLPATTLAVHSIYHLQFVAVAGLAAGGSANGIFRSFAESVYWTNLWWAFPGGSDQLVDGDCRGVDSAGVPTDISLGNAILVFGLLPTIFVLHLLLASIFGGCWVARRMAADSLVLEAEFAAEATAAAKASAAEESHLSGSGLDGEAPNVWAPTGFGSNSRAGSHSSSQTSNELAAVQAPVLPTEAMERMRKLWASSPSLLLRLPNIELVFLLWAYEGAAVAQLSMATRACSWGAIVLGAVLWILFPLLLMLYVWQFVLCRVHSGTPFFVYLYKDRAATAHKAASHKYFGGGGASDTRGYYGGTSSRRVAVVPAGSGVRDEIGKVSCPTPGSRSGSRSVLYGSGSGGRSGRVPVVPDRTADEREEEMKQAEDTKEEERAAEAVEAAAAHKQGWDRDTESSAGGGCVPNGNGLRDGNVLAESLTSERRAAHYDGDGLPGSSLRQASGGVHDGLSGGRSASIFEWAERGSWRVTARDKASSVPAVRSSLLMGLAPLYGDYHSGGMPYFVLSLGLVLATAVAVATITHGSAALAALLGLAAVDLLALLWLQPFGNAAVNWLETSAVFFNLATLAALLTAATLPGSATPSSGGGRDSRDKALIAAVVFAVASVLVVMIPCYMDLAAVALHWVCERHEKRRARKESRGTAAAVAKAAAPGGSGGGNGATIDHAAATITAVDAAALRPTAWQYREGFVVALRGNLSLTVHVLAKSVGQETQRRPKARAVMPRRAVPGSLQESPPGTPQGRAAADDEEIAGAFQGSAVRSQGKGWEAPTELEAAQRRLSPSRMPPLESSQGENQLPPAVLVEPPEAAEERAGGVGGVQGDDGYAHAPRF